MLTNYHKINEETSVETFLKEISEKKNSNYIILEGNEFYVDFRDIALNVSNSAEKLKTLKRKLSNCDSEKESDCLNHLIESGEKVIKVGENILDITNTYQMILNDNPDFLNKTIQEIETRKEVYALEENDKIATAKSFLKDKKTNLLPVIENLKIVGEVRTQDLLANQLFANGNHEKSSYFNENHNESIMNLPISNIMNSKAHTIEKTATIKKVLTRLNEKKMESIIVTDENDKLFSIFTYKDVFRLIREEKNKAQYNLEFVGTKHLYEDEEELLEIYSRRTMDKITKLSDYDTLKATIKPIGNTTGTHMRKMNLKLLLSHGNHIISMEKELHSSTIDEQLHSHEKENWNIPKMCLEALKNLESQVKNERAKR